MMKNFKKFTAFVLALCMLFSLSVAAFAAEADEHTIYDSAPDEETAVSTEAATSGTIQNSSICCPSAGSIVAKAESIKNSLDSDQVKAVSTFRPHIDGGDRRIQKRKSGAHILDMRTECHRHLGRIARSIEGCGYRLVVVIRTACADGAHRGDQEDDGRENSDQPPADPFAELLVGKGCCRDFGDHTCCYCHQRPPAVPNSFSL